jgi:hypothetical protein
MEEAINRENINYSKHCRREIQCNITIQSEKGATNRPTSKISSGMFITSKRFNNRMSVDT